VVTRLALGRPGRGVDAPPTVTASAVLRRRLPVDVIGRGHPGMALVVDERNRMGWVRLTPWFAAEPWRSMALGPDRAIDPDRRMGRALGPA